MAIASCFNCLYRGNMGKDSSGHEICFCLHPLDHTVHDAVIGCEKHLEVA